MKLGKLETGTSAGEKWGQNGEEPRVPAGLWDTAGETRDFRWGNGLWMQELGIPGGFAVILREKPRIPIGFAQILTEELGMLHWAWNCGDI